MADETNKTEPTPEEIKEVEIKLEETTQERLDKVFDGDSTPSDDSTPASEKPDEKPAAEETEKSDDSTPVDEKPAEESGASDDSTPAESEPESKPDEKPAAEKTTGVSDAYYRAAKHQGWDDEEIKNLHDANPELANKTFAKLLESTNRLSQEFAAMGRARQQQQVQQQTAVRSEPEKVEKSEFKEIDIAQLKKDYDNDPIVELVEQQQKQMKQLYDKMDAIPVQTGIQTSEDEVRVKLQAEEVVNQQVVQYFKADDLKPYKEFYGAVPKGSNGWDGLTTEQKGNRWAVLELAEQILTGAESQGRKMDVSEALGSAHLIVSEPMREKIIRNDIKSKTVKRSKGLSLKPNSGNAPASTGGPMSDATLEAKTLERLHKVFG